MKKEKEILKSIKKFSKKQAKLANKFTELEEEVKYILSQEFEGQAPVKDYPVGKETLTVTEVSDDRFEIIVQDEEGRTSGLSVSKDIYNQLRNHFFKV